SAARPPKKANERRNIERYRRVSRCGRTAAAYAALASVLAIRCVRREWPSPTVQPSRIRRKLDASVTIRCAPNDPPAGPAWGGVELVRCSTRSEPPSVLRG